MKTAIDWTKEELMEAFEVRDGRIWRKEHVDTCGRKQGGLIKNVGNHNQGYCLVNFKGRLVRYHRLLWILVNGPIPAGLVIDHKDGNPLNNNISNLRLLTVRENAQNKFYHRTGKLCGVHWHKQNGKWQAKIWVNGKNKHLGLFDTELAAFDAYIQANKEQGLSVWLLEEHRELYLENRPNKAVVERKEGVAT